MEVAGPSGYDTIYNGCLCDLDTPIIGVRRTSEALEKKNSPNIWWIRKVVVPLHSQLKRRGVPERAR